MKVSFLNKLALVAVSFLVFSCEKEDEVMVSQDTLTQEESAAKLTVVPEFERELNVTVVVKDSKGKELSTSKFKDLQIIAINQLSRKVYKPSILGRQFRNLPIGRYSFLGKHEVGKLNIVGIRDVIIRDLEGDRKNKVIELGTYMNLF